MKSALEANQEYVKANSKTPPTVKDVLLKMLDEDTEMLASLKIGYDSHTDAFYTTDVRWKLMKRYKHVREALEAEIAYLNSAAEVGK